MQIYEEDEIETLMRMLQSESELWRMMFTLALAAGLRKGELLGLEWKDVDFDNQQIYIHQSIVLTKQGPHIKSTKTKKSKRYVTLPESVMEELKAYRIHWAKEKLKKVINGLNKIENGYFIRLMGHTYIQLALQNIGTSLLMNGNSNTFGFTIYVTLLHHY